MSSAPAPEGYPGNPSLPREVRDKILSTFRHTLNLFKEGKRDDCLIGCDFILKMDPRFTPARQLLEKTKKVGGTTVHYKVVLPNGYDSAKPYPGILALGGGPQTMNTVDAVLNRNFRAEAEKRGYIVVAPAAPDDQLFFENGARIFPEFLKMILADYKIQDDKFHVAGPSNGGIAALHIAASNPQYFLSVTSFPGFMWQPSATKLLAISKMCVFMYVGEFDRYRWHGEMQFEVDYLRSQGTLARYTVEKD